MVTLDVAEGMSESERKVSFANLLAVMPLATVSNILYSTLSEDDLDDLANLLATEGSDDTDEGENDNA